MPTNDLHGLAVSAEQNLEKLATGLAQAGADDGTVKAVSQMADVTRKVIKALGKGQAATGDGEPAPPEAAAQPEQPQQPQTIGGATDQLHQSMQPKPAPAPQGA